MIPVTIVAKPLVGAMAKKFAGAVVERWTRHRAECFLQSFVDAVAFEHASGLESEDTDRLLDKILQDENNSEVLFDAYRRVCFSKSKEVGPRIVGLLAARLVMEGRMADETEQDVFAAAELLSDGELVEFMKNYARYRQKAEGITDPEAEYRTLTGSIIIRWSQQSSHFSFPGGDKYEIGELDLSEALGKWAVRLKQSGLLSTRVEQAFVPKRSKFMTDQDVLIPSVTTTITFEHGCAELYDLASRSFGPTSAQTVVT